MSSWISTAATIGAAGFIWHRIKTTNTSTSFNSTTTTTTTTSTSETPTTPSTSIRVAYGTQTGTSSRLAHLLVGNLRRGNNNHELPTNTSTSIVNLLDYDVDNLEKENIIIFVMCTWEGGVPPESATIFCNWLKDMAQDFRVPNTFLSNTKYAVFGLGSSEYAPVDRFCTAALELDEHMYRLGAKRIVNVGMGDASKDIEMQFLKWSRDQLWPALLPSTPSSSTSSSSTSTTSTISSKDTLSWDELTSDSKGLLRPVVTPMADRVPLAQHRRNKRKAKREARLRARTEVVETDEDRLNASLVDVEDLAVTMAAGKAAVKEEIHINPEKRPEMVTPLQRKALTKEGYDIIGTHSAVKLCRWTKHQLRGRGGCYKHTCYGIVSYQCMEATPSLACANKCVFCWRHHKNPVGTKWRWRQDDPDLIVTQAVERHRKMIHSAKGVPGVKMDRWMAAKRGPKHCALSLVGEPIMYPEINKLLTLLDGRGISTFLVTNAQFPDAIRDLSPCTQLYISIDAATRDALKAVDRPLFPDFWERFLASIDSLREKDLHQRTVFRMTLVKQWNMDMKEECERYANLIRRGRPDFIEIKSVTFCGVSDGSNLTMKNVPWYEEVVKYAQAVCAFLPGEYEIACAHKHSCLVLIANTRYKMKTKVTSQEADENAEAAAEDRLPIPQTNNTTFITDANTDSKSETKNDNDDSSNDAYHNNEEYAWHTWIDYPKWTQLVNEYHRTNGKATFSKLDYVARTPSWALYGAPEAGFSPYEVHFKRSANGRTVTNERSASAKEIAEGTSVGIADYESEPESGGCG